MKIFRNYIFRISVFLLIFGATVFCPLVFVMPGLSSTENKVILGCAVIALAAVEGVLYVFLNYKLIVAPLKTINSTVKRLSNGEYAAHSEIKFADSEILSLQRTADSLAEEFRNLEQMRKSFIANASHELRSPLTSIQGFLQAILDGTIDKQDYEKYLKIVLNETKRLNSLINSMLDLSRMESGKNPLSQSRFEINSLITQVIERFEPNLLKKELQLNADFAGDATYVFADKEKITQVLINLIDNAIKYSPAYSQILVSTYLHKDKIYVKVKDSGLGINKRDQMLIWDKFYMADRARTPGHNKGTGLGLSIVKKIIDDHNETVWVESKKGLGSTFIFTLPLFDPAKHKTEKDAFEQKSE